MKKILKQDVTLELATHVRYSSRYVFYVESLIDKFSFLSK